MNAVRTWQGNVVSLVEAFRLVIKELLMSRGRKLSRDLNRLSWSMNEEFCDLDGAELEEAVSSYLAHEEKAFQHEFDRAISLAFTKIEIGEAIDAVLSQRNSR